jgi:hypothetical protein
MSATQRESHGYNPFDFGERLRFESTTVKKSKFLPQLQQLK